MSQAHINKDLFLCFSKGWKISACFQDVKYVYFSKQLNSFDPVIASRYLILCVWGKHTGSSCLV
jgi:hypothetical protein